MDDDTIRIVVSTDNHLGYMGKDPVRGDDSFAAFEEVLVVAKERKADFVLLAGDMFHENKPSKRTLYSALDLLKRHCMGDAPVFTEIINENANILNTSSGHVNYEDPTQAISLPVFAIHGNHDDTSREGCGDALSALDILAAANLINYFGKNNEVDNIVITPILFKKNNTYVGLYGLGAIRDERLNRMWHQKKVTFYRPSPTTGITFINIFVLHQNRDYGRGKKNCIHESMIPEWMDIVIWGNEHECIPEFVESLVGTFRIYQPGSSVATSYSEGESTPKHMGIIEVNKKRFRLEKIPYHNVRSFIYADINLNDYNLNPTHRDIEAQMQNVLKQKVDELLRDHPAAAPTINTSYKIKHPDKILLRLRVQHSNLPTISTTRFGAQYVDSVANCQEILLFSKRRDDQVANATNKKDRNVSEFAIATEDLEKIRIEDLITDTLRSSNKQLQLLSIEQMTQAIEDFVLKKDNNAISELLNDCIETKLGALGGKKKNTAARAPAKITATVNNVQAKATTVDAISDDDDDVPMAPAKRGRKTEPAAKKTTKPRGRAKKSAPSASEADSDMEIEALKPVGARNRPKRVAAKPAPVVDISDDDVVEDASSDDQPPRHALSDSEEEAPIRSKKRTTPQSKNKNWNSKPSPSSRSAPLETTPVAATPASQATAPRSMVSTQKKVSGSISKLW